MCFFLFCHPSLTFLAASHNHINTNTVINPSMKIETSASQKKRAEQCDTYLYGSITGSPLIFRAFLLVHKEYSDEEMLVFTQCAKILLDNVVNRRMDIGPQRQTTIAEHNLTARFALLLQHLYSTVLTDRCAEPLVEVGHQNKVAGQLMDVTLYHATKQGPHPRVIFEFSTGDANKQFQLHAYVSNADFMLPKNCYLIALGVVVVLSSETSTSTITLYGHYKVLVQDESSHRPVGKVCTVHLFSGIWNTATLARVLRVCDWFVNLDMSFFELPTTGVPRVNWPTVLMSGDGTTVFKSYDYRSRPVDEERSRNANLALKYLPDCHIIPLHDLLEDCTVIEYPKIAGEHTPASNKSALGVIASLHKMHTDGNVHMDVKAGNCLFNDSDHHLSTLIDFDLSRPLESATYPLNYVVDITDGQRHPNASPGCAGAYEHDAFALAAVLSRSRPQETERKEDWDDVCRLVETCQLEEAIHMLKNQDYYKLTLKVMSGTADATGTGSPQK